MASKRDTCTITYPVFAFLTIWIQQANNNCIIPDLVHKTDTFDQNIYQIDSAIKISLPGTGHTTIEISNRRTNYVTPGEKIQRAYSYFK